MNRWELLDLALSRVCILDGLFCEFGVYKGKSINYIAKKIYPHTIHGFDSFKGLPEDWRKGKEKGTFRLEDKSLCIVDSNVMIHEGDFHLIIPDFLNHFKRYISFMHIDCDVYTSARDVLCKCRKRIIPGTVIVFDEYHGYVGCKHHEQKAWEEFVKLNNVLYETINKSTEGIAFRVMQLRG